MKKTLLAIILTFIVISCASEETPTPTAPEGNVPAEPIIPSIPPIVKAQLKPAITNNIKSLTAKKVEDDLKLVKRVYYYKNVPNFSQEAAIKDSLNTFKDTLTRWWGSRTD